MSKNQVQKSKKISKTNKSDGKLRAQFKIFKRLGMYKSSGETTKKPASTVPGVLVMTKEVAGVLWLHRWILIKFVFVAWVGLLLLVGASQQEQFKLLQANIENLTGSIGSGLGASATNVGYTIVAITAGGLNGALSEGQQIYSNLAYLFIWLTAIWLLRYLLAGRTVKLRDAFYNAGAPLVSTVIVVLVGLVQLIPAMIGAFIIATITTRQFSSQWYEVGAFGVLAVVFIILSLYWVGATIIAAITVTLPGTYPIRAYAQARRLTRGIRAKILIHVTWLLSLTGIVFMAVLAPVILMSGYVRVTWLPLVATYTQLVAVIGIVFVATYMYLVYRRLISDKSNS